MVIYEKIIDMLWLCKYKESGVYWAVQITAGTCCSHWQTRKKWSQLPQHAFLDALRVYFVVISTVYIRLIWIHVALELIIPPGVLRHTQLPLQHSLSAVKYFCISQCIQYYPDYLPFSLGIGDLTRCLYCVYKYTSQFLDQHVIPVLMMKQLRRSDQCLQRL